MYLGIDLGTSGVKLLLATPEQKTVGSATAPLTVSNPHSGWSEQDPQDWITATRIAISQLMAAHPAEWQAIRAIGLSGQMHGATLLDQQDAVLRPSILWNDTRSYEEAAALDAMPQFRDLTGNIVFPGFTAPKLNWVRQHEPELFARTRKVLLPKDYLRLWLTGSYVSDLSDASGTGWLDMAQRRWAGQLLAECGLDLDQMPDLVEGCDPAGQLRPTLAQDLGLSPSVTVAGGAGDNAAAAIATGVIEPGSGIISLGTSGTIFAANNSYLPNAESAVHTFCHALPNRWHQMGVILSATASLNWFAGITGVDAPALTEELGTELTAPGDALFLPYLAGERTPHNDALVRGSFHGLGSEVTRRDLTRAVLEGVAFALRDNLEALRATGTELQSVLAVGGGSKSPYWLSVIATALNLPIQLPRDGEYGAAFGAVRLAMLADGLTPLDTICTPAQTDRSILPEQSLLAAFDDAYLRYRAAYQVGG